MCFYFVGFFVGFFVVVVIVLLFLGGLLLFKIIYLICFIFNILID